MAGNGGVNGSMLQYGDGGFVEWDGIIGCRAGFAGMERRSFLDRSINSN